MPAMTTGSTGLSWKCCYYFDEKVSAIHSKARFGRLRLEGDTLTLSGEDELRIAKEGIVSLEKVWIPLGVRAVRSRTKALTVIVCRELCHFSRSLVFAHFQGAMCHALLAFHKR
jgi:hypothetical protein